jgi:hypothetical protein
MLNAAIEHAWLESAPKSLITRKSIAKGRDDD